MRLVRNFVLLIILFRAGDVRAQHPIEVERYAAEGEYFKAMVAFDRLPERRATIRARMAGAASAWGIGLPERAIAEYEKLLQDKSLSDNDRARLYLSRGAIEYQEDRYQVANLFAERSVALLSEASPLRAQALVLWGQSLMKLGSPGQAEEKLTQALDEALPADRADISFQLGECEIKLGKFDAARHHLEQVPLRHARTALAIRYLAQLAIERNEPEQTTFWLTKGRDEYPREFLDSWVDYALVTAAIQMDNPDEVKRVSSQALNRFPPSDQWVTLLQAASEAYLWSNSKGASPNTPHHTSTASTPRQTMETP